MIMEIISGKRTNMNGLCGLKKIVGAPVISKDGDEIGKVVEIFFTEHKIAGFVLSHKKGPKVFIGEEYIEKFNEDAVIIKINPITSMIGLTVFDSAGKKIGIVKEVVRQNNSNSFTGIEVKGSVLRKKKTIPKSEIDEIKHTIMLNKEI